MLLLRNAILSLGTLHLTGFLLHRNFSFILYIYVPRFQDVCGSFAVGRFPYLVYLNQKFMPWRMFMKCIFHSCAIFSSSLLSFLLILTFSLFLGLLLFIFYSLNKSSNVFIVSLWFLSLCLVFPQIPGGIPYFIFQ